VSADIVIAGHSHTAALGVPLDSAMRLVPVAHPRAAFAILAGPWPRTKAYWRELVRIAHGRMIAVVWMGNQHADFIFAPEPLFDLVKSRNTDLPMIEGAVVVPEMLIREYFRPTLTSLHALLQELVDAGAGRIVVVGTPPPKNADHAFRRLLCREESFVNHAREFGIDLATVPLTPSLIQYKLWLVIQDLLEEAGNSIAMPFLAVPDVARDAAGFLREPYWGADATHANAAYGAVLLEHLARRFEHA
jgi:hypothetical protein